MIYESSFDSLPVIAGPDHPLSLGYTVRLCLRDPRQPKAHRAPKKAYVDFIGGSGDCKGLHAVWDRNRTVIIFINCKEDGKLVPMSRIAGLVAHECSHAVDGFIARAHVSVVDTELRAYFLDWLVEWILRSYETH